MRNEEAVGLIDQHVNALMEHFEAVHILATWRDDGSENTHGLSRGGGNWYARIGMAQEMVHRDRCDLEKDVRDG